jgi:hypothetical protein
MHATDFSSGSEVEHEASRSTMYLCVFPAPEINLAVQLLVIGKTLLLVIEFKSRLEKDDYLAQLSLELLCESTLLSAVC